MRRIKICIIFLFVFIMAQLPLTPDEWGNCYCINNEEVFMACELVCGSEEACKGVHKQGEAKCIETSCKVTYYVMCQNPDDNAMVIFEEPCEDDCPQEFWQ